MIQNSSSHYGLISMLLHWTMAIAFFALFALGLYMVELDYYDPWYHQAPDIHKALGVIIFFVMILRFLWNKSQIKPNANDEKSLSNKAAHLVHKLFYLFVVLLFISGYLISTAKGKPIDIFNLFQLPAVLEENSERGDFAGEIHQWIAYLFIALASTHAGAALYHHFYLKDSVLKRMLKIK